MKTKQNKRTGCENNHPGLTLRTGFWKPSKWKGKEVEVGSAHSWN